MRAWRVAASQSGSAPSGIARGDVGRGRVVPGGEVGELALEVGQALGQAVPLLA